MLRKTNTIALFSSWFWGGFFAIGVTITSEVTHPSRENHAKSKKKKKNHLVFQSFHLISFFRKFLRLKTKTKRKSVGHSTTGTVNAMKV